MSTLINVVQSSHNHRLHMDLEEGRTSEAIGAIEATEATRMYHKDNKEDYSRQASQDIRVIRRHKKAEDICMSECKACICLSVVTMSILYAITVLIILIVEDHSGSERTYGPVGPVVIPEDGSLS